MRSSRIPDKAQAEQHNMIFGCGLVLLGTLGFSAKSIIIKLAYAASAQLVPSPFCLAARSKSGAISGRCLQIGFADGRFFYCVAAGLMHAGIRRIGAGM